MSPVYNPTKGYSLAKSFMDLFSDYSYFPLKNFSEHEILMHLDSAKVYIDFGEFPGKDRIPREAISRGCIIFIHNQNCATDYDSFPLDEYFKFSNEDVINGTLAQKVDFAFENYNDLKKQQFSMYDSVCKEQSFFKEQVKNLFKKS